MKRLIVSQMIVALFFLALSPIATFAAEAKGVVVEDIKVERMEYADPENAWLLVSCLVRNMTEEDGNVSVVIRTIDKWAYDRKPFYLTGFLKAGEERRLSVQQVMDAKMYEGLRKYEIQSAEIH